MRHVQDNAESRCARDHPAENGAFTLPLDNGAQIQVASGGHEKPQRGDRFTARRPAEQQLQCAHRGVYGGVLYVFRTLVDDDIPLNAAA